MKGFSWSKEDFRALLIMKYKMEITYIYGDDCSKCRFLRPHVEKRAKDHEYNFVAMQYADSGLEISSIPTMIIETKGKKEIYDYDGIINFISKNK